MESDFGFIATRLSFQVHLKTGGRLWNLHLGGSPAALGAELLIAAQFLSTSAIMREELTLCCAAVWAKIVMLEFHTFGADHASFLSIFMRTY